MQLTKQDRGILLALSRYQSARARAVADMARINTISPSETAARHLIKLTKLGLARQTGTRMFPSWQITNEGMDLVKETANDA